jgi:hypothetical protein
MIKISPKTGSGLSYTTYKLQLPGVLFPLQARPERVRTTLSGAAIVSTWRKRQDGAKVTKNFGLSSADFDTLMAISEHETVFEWVLATAGRSYNATVDVISAEQVQGRSVINWRVTVAFTIIERLAE